MSVELTQDEGDGALFLDDICNMLERIADRVGLHLERSTSTTASKREYRLPSGASFPRELERETGSHRGQLVPRGSASRRVVTAKVYVKAGPRRSHGVDGIIKTYNYPLNRVSIHETGQTVPLDVVMSGAQE